MRVQRFGFTALCFFLFTGWCAAQASQDEYPRWQVFGGFSYLSNPKNNSNQRGFEFSGGYNILRWLTLGVDTTHYGGWGDAPTTIPELELIGLPGTIAIPFKQNTTTIAIGPQFAYRHSRWIVPFARPGIGLVYASVTAHQPNGFPIPLPLPPTRSEWRMFYGFGGGFEFPVIPHGALTVSSDYLRAQLFGQGLNNVRVTGGITIYLGSKTGK